MLIARVHIIRIIVWIMELANIQDPPLGGWLCVSIFLSRVLKTRSSYEVIYRVS